MARSAHPWHPITPLDETTASHQAPSLVGLSSAWREEREAMRALDVERHFLDRWKRRLAVETGVIEGLYTLDRGVTATLIERGFDSALIPNDATDQDPELVVNLLRDQREAVDMVFDVVAQRRRLTLSFVKELHSLLTTSQRTTTAYDQFGRAMVVDLVRGRWKTLPNNPTRQDGTVHEYCPPEQVSPEMERLVEWTESYTADGISPDVVAAWCHHRFTQIHPFQDGNGRVARLLATLVLVRAGWLPLVVERDQRVEYLDALEAADRGSLGDLIGFVDRRQRTGFMKALSVAAEVQREQQDELKDLLGSLREAWSAEPAKPRNGLDTVAEALREDALTLMSEVGDELEPIVRLRFPRGNVWVDGDSPDTAAWYRSQRIRLASEFDYFADFTRYSHWVRLKIDLDVRFDVLVSLTGVGRDTGAIAAVTGAWEISPSDDGPATRPVQVLSPEPFTATGRETPEVLRQRFVGWLRADVARALVLWQRGQ